LWQQLEQLEHELQASSAALGVAFEAAAEKPAPASAARASRMSAIRDLFILV
jgi:hypothetical protein